VLIGCNFLFFLASNNQNKKKSKKISFQIRKTRKNSFFPFCQNSLLSLARNSAPDEFCRSFHVELAESLPGSNQRSPYPTRRRKGSLTQSCSKIFSCSLHFAPFCSTEISFLFLRFARRLPFRRFCLLGSSSSAKSSTLPLPHRLNVERPYVPKDRERDGYYR
jgi:hypothetical protein